MKRILLSRVLNPTGVVGAHDPRTLRTTMSRGGVGTMGTAGRRRYCSSFEVSPSSFRYYSTSVEYLTGNMMANQLDPSHCSTPLFNYRMNGYTYV